MRSIQFDKKMLIVGLIVGASLIGCGKKETPAPPPPVAPPPVSGGGYGGGSAGCQLEVPNPGTPIDQSTNGNTAFFTLIGNLASVGNAQVQGTSVTSYAVEATYNGMMLKSIATGISQQTQMPTYYQIQVNPNGPSITLIPQTGGQPVTYQYTNYVEVAQGYYLMTTESVGMFVAQGYGGNQGGKDFLKVNNSPNPSISRCTIQQVPPSYNPGYQNYTMELRVQAQTLITQPRNNYVGGGYPQQPGGYPQMPGGYPQMPGGYQDPYGGGYQDPYGGGGYPQLPPGGMYGAVTY